MAFTRVVVYSRKYDLLRLCIHHPRVNIYNWRSGFALKQIEQNELLIVPSNLDS
jgi:hypothetical protein